MDNLRLKTISTSDNDLNEISCATQSVESRAIECLNQNCGHIEN